MLQDIEPHHFQNKFCFSQPAEKDCLIVWRKDAILLRITHQGTTIPSFAEIKMIYTQLEKPIYLFSVDEYKFFLSRQAVDEKGCLQYRHMKETQRLRPAWLPFACATAAHLARWYDVHRICGRCGLDLVLSSSERAVFCPHCGVTTYPNISPVIIVGVTDGDHLLLTRYAQGEYQKHALIAGFVEIGETLEDAARREVQEETGLCIKNLHYYKSQPWAFSESLLAGFFAEVDGSTDVHVDQVELSEAIWFSRETLPLEDTTLSLTWDMIETFRRGEV